MKINAHLFQAAGTVYQALLSQKANMMPEHPEHAWRALDIAKKLQDACGGDPVVTNVAARLLAGYMQNTQSGHSSNDEFVRWGAAAVRHLIAAFNEPVPAPQTTHYVPAAAQASRYPEMPPQPAGPRYPSPAPHVEAPPPLAAQPIAPVVPPAAPLAPSDIPDFS